MADVLGAARGFWSASMMKVAPGIGGFCSMAANGQ